MPLNDLIHFTACVLQSKGEPLRSVKERVRAKVKYHQKCGNLPTDDPITASTFFTWAIHSGGYSQLIDVNDLPLPAIRGEVAARQQSAASQSFGTIIPGDMETLQKKYAALSIAMREAEKKAVLAEEDKRALQTYKEKEASLRKKNSEAGKRGGRGNML